MTVRSASAWTLLAVVFGYGGSASPASSQDAWIALVDAPVVSIDLEDFVEFSTPVLVHVPFGKSLEVLTCEGGWLLTLETKSGDNWEYFFDPGCEDTWTGTRRIDGPFEARFVYKWRVFLGPNENRYRSQLDGPLRVRVMGPGWTLADVVPTDAFELSGR